MFAATVVLPTFRRPDGLARVLGALARQRDVGVPWDVIVVDNDEPPGATATFERHVRALREAGISASRVHESRRGAAHARNRGIAEASGSIIVFVDDDVEPEDGWLAALLEPILAGRADAVGGRVVLDPSVARPRWFNEVHLAPALAAFELGPDEVLIPAVGYLVTASAAFPTAALRAIGGFDPTLGPRDGMPLVNDDVQLFRDFCATGGRVVYAPAAVVTHELPASRLTRRYILRRLYAQGRSDWLLNRAELATKRWGGAPVALRELGKHTRIALAQGIWHRHCAYSVVQRAAIAAGFLREALAHRSSAP